jgi:glucose/arabinose dehydrogenase/mono/diheme cytochrome c family protein
MRIAMRLLFFILLFFPSCFLLAQSGDKKGEQQVSRVPREKIPPAPALTATEALKTFTLQDGFRMELVASEPMVEDPVAITFDLQGRLWVVEMRGFMPNLDGAGEREPSGRVSILEDTDHDGRMDKRTIFLDGLILPRALAIVRDGVLIAEPPKLWFCRDTNGDGKADEKTEVANDYGDPKNPEHCANGLLVARDNYIYSLYHTWRYRWMDGKWMREFTPNRTQWGLAQDDFGRFFYTSNSDHLRGDMTASHYLVGKLPGTKLPGIAFKVATNQTVWPGRVNPGVNRGYQADALKEDGRLNKFTAACGTTIYRGDLFPKRFYGNAFVCEPAANLIRRSVLTERDGIVTSRNAYAEKEFLTSTDERFRPVTLANGPDGALYVVDMYKGVLQHRIYVTSYLRHQIEERGLDNPIHMGRIYRIMPPNGKAAAPPDLAAASSAALVKCLSHANGWQRDTAQRLLVERKDTSSIPALMDILKASDSSIARLHALWTLEGMGVADAEVVNIALSDRDPKIRAAAIRIAESKPTARPAVLKLLSDSAPDVQIQLALTLGLPDFTDQKAALKTIETKASCGLARELATFSLGGGEPKMAKRKTGPAIPLTAEQRKLLEVGKGVYEATCLACHQGHGLGQEGLAPPLVDSEWVSGSPERLARIVIQGLRGPIRVKKQQYELDMPSLGVLDDEQIAGAITYVRRSWGHGFSPVDAAFVKRVREATKSREDAWTEAELLKLK